MGCLISIASNFVLIIKFLIFKITKFRYQTAVLVLFEAGMSVFAVSSLDKVAAGIWSSVFYLIAGLLGFSLSHVPTHTKYL